jgi:mevalonate kinase
VKTYYSNGKLLLTGEYVVLDGAKALALPTRYGQDLKVSSGTNATIHWTSYDADHSIWFEDSLSFSEIIHHHKNTENNPVKNTLLDILHHAYQQHPDFITQSEGYEITTSLTFPRLWGLGTSSTLIANIAQWLNIDAYTLLRGSFGGSGYDVACATNNTPILYQLVQGKPTITSVEFHPEFHPHLYFLYLNKKQSSKAAIATYYSKNNSIEKTITQISKITEQVLHTDDLKSFVYQMEKHEVILSDVLETLTVKESLFDDFKGVVKSLGAWGGDFVLVISKDNPEGYFKERGFDTLIPYREMIL